jgi:hypothetical protein
MKVVVDLSEDAPTCSEFDGGQEGRIVQERKTTQHKRSKVLAPLPPLRCKRGAFSTSGFGS